MSTKFSGHGIPCGSTEGNEGDAGIVGSSFFLRERREIPRTMIGLRCVLEGEQVNVDVDSPWTRNGRDQGKDEPGLGRRACTRNLVSATPDHQNLNEDSLSHDASVDHIIRGYSPTCETLHFCFNVEFGERINFITEAYKEISNRLHTPARESATVLSAFSYLPRSMLRDCTSE
jgi:hypothetical protein